ncbi:hypothetical protein OSB04_011981 [Centaurea solstitialis]|uniref:Plasma membrane-associated cation-binding protein 1 n=1 Tax=Centaurea solstitialis TaxID=347529 RepID=A0AA38TTL5_9ASTR|nr:hypothetical protein OSB04_011981 [Centaurea solstitialis]
MGYWKSTVVPKFKKLFEKNTVKKAGAAEACKSFDAAKELVKERKDGALKKISSGIDKFLEELSKIEFPGSKPAHEACCKYGPTLVEGPIFFVFEKVSTFIVVEEKKEEETPVPVTEPESEPKPEPEAAPVEETSGKEKEIVVEEEKKEEVEKTPETTAAKAEEVVVATTEPPKAC